MVAIPYCLIYGWFKQLVPDILYFLFIIFFRPLSKLMGNVHFIEKKTRGTREGEGDDRQSPAFYTDQRFWGNFETVLETSIGSYNITVLVLLREVMSNWLIIFNSVSQFAHHFTVFNIFVLLNAYTESNTRKHTTVCNGMPWCAILNTRMQPILYMWMLNMYNSLLISLLHC